MYELFSPFFLIAEAIILLPFYLVYCWAVEAWDKLLEHHRSQKLKRKARVQARINAHLNRPAPAGTWCE